MEYTYVGPRDLLLQAAAGPAGFPVRGKADLQAWFRRHGGGGKPLVVTFVIDPSGLLLVAERQTEHVVCAGGGPVLAAGEMVLEGGQDLRVVGVTNQSTGYCPDARCWPAVKTTLSELGVAFPERLSHTFVFRRCETCGQINVVKEDDLLCSVCSGELPAWWNF